MSVADPFMRHREYGLVTSIGFHGVYAQLGGTAIRRIVHVDPERNLTVHLYRVHAVLSTPLTAGAHNHWKIISIDGRLWCYRNDQDFTKHGARRIGPIETQGALTYRGSRPITNFPV